MDEEDSSQIEAYAKYIGLDPILDSNFIWLAKQGLYSELPKGWESSVDPNSNEIYYFKHRSGGRKPIVTWEHPKDEYYKELFCSILKDIYIYILFIIVVEFVTS